MDILEWREVILKSEIFVGITPEELPHLMQCLCGRLQAYKKNETIAIAETAFTGMGIVLSGEVAVIKESMKGNRNILTICRAGDTFGELIAFSGSPFWPATVSTLTDAVVFFIQGQKLISFCNAPCVSHRQLVENTLKMVAKKAMILNRKLEYLSIKSIRGKIVKYLLENYKKHKSLTFSMPLNREEMADFLAVSRPSLSRELGKLRDEKVIDFFKESIRILDLEALIELLES